MILGSLARRYARALIETAREENKVEEFGQTLGALLEILKKDPVVLEALANESFDVAERLAASEAIAARLGHPLLLKNFLLLLVKKERIGALPEIVREYLRMSDEILGIVRVTVASPEGPEPTVLRRVEKILGQRTGKKVMASGETRPGILGGLVLKMDHTIYDGSIRRELDRLREAMLEV